MRRSPRKTLLTLSAVALAFAAAGCGTSEVSADEVPGGPPALIVPSDSELGATGSKADASSDSTDTGTADSSADAQSDTSGTSGTAAPTTATEPSGGTTAPAAPEDTTTDPAQPPAAGSAPEQFETFCEQNAGAC